MTTPSEHKMNEIGFTTVHRQSDKPLFRSYNHDIEGARESVAQVQGFTITCPGTNAILTHKAVCQQAADIFHELATRAMDAANATEFTDDAS